MGIARVLTVNAGYSPFGTDFQKPGLGKQYQIPDSVLFRTDFGTPYLGKCTTNLGPVLFRARFRNPDLVTQTLWAELFFMQPTFSEPTSIE